MRFADKIAIVTGAGQGIGEVYAGAVRTDVADPESVEALAAATMEAFGGIDYLVNNAAIYGGSCP